MKRMQAVCPGSFTCDYLYLKLPQDWINITRIMLQSFRNLLLFGYFNRPPHIRQYLSMFMFFFCFSTKYNYLAWRIHISVLSVQVWFKEDLWLQPINLLISDGAPVRKAPSNPFLQLCIAKFCTHRQISALIHAKRGNNKVSHLSFLNHF